MTSSGQRRRYLVLACGLAASIASTAHASTVVCGAATNGAVQGVDVSHYQGSFDWASAKANGTVFGVASVGDGTGFTDPDFGTNWANMAAAGIYRGAYQYFEPEEDPVAQGDLMVQAVGQLGGGDLPCTLDVETTGGQSGGTIAANVQTWLNVVQQGTGRTPFIYTGPYFWDGSVGSTAFGSTPLWIADYGPSCPAVPNGWSNWTIWQYGDSGGTLDQDVFNGTLADLQALDQVVLPGGRRHHRDVRQRRVQHRRLRGLRRELRRRFARDALRLRQVPRPGDRDPLRKRDDDRELRQRRRLVRRLQRLRGGLRRRLAPGPVRLLGVPRGRRRHHLHRRQHAGRLPQRRGLVSRLHEDGRGVRDVRGGGVLLRGARRDQGIRHERRAGDDGRSRRLRPLLGRAGHAQVQDRERRDARVDRHERPRAGGHGQGRPSRHVRRDEPQRPRPAHGGVERLAHPEQQPDGRVERPDLHDERLRPDALHAHRHRADEDGARHEHVAAPRRVAVVVRSRPGAHVQRPAVHRRWRGASHGRGTDRRGADRRDDGRCPRRLAPPDARRGDTRQRYGDRRHARIGQRMLV